MVPRRLSLPLPQPKHPPASLGRKAEKTKRETADETGSREAKQRANGRCEIVIVGVGRCQKRDVHTHHLIGGWKQRGRGKSALAVHKQRACVEHHVAIEHNELKRIASGPDPVYTDCYEMAT